MYPKSTDTPHRHTCGENTESHEIKMEEEEEEETHTSYPGLESMVFHCVALVMRRPMNLFKLMFTSHVSAHMA